MGGSNNNNEKDADEEEASPRNASSGDDTNIKAQTKEILDLTSSEVAAAGGAPGRAMGTSGTGNNNDEEQQQQSRREPTSSSRAPTTSKETSLAKTAISAVASQGNGDIEASVGVVLNDNDAAAAEAAGLVRRQTAPGAFAMRSHRQGQGGAPAAQHGATSTLAAPERSSGPTSSLPLAAELAPDNTELEAAMLAAQAERDEYKERLAEIERSGVSGVTAAATATAVNIDNPADQHRKCMLQALIGIILTIGIVLAVIFGTQTGDGASSNNDSISNTNLTTPEPEIIEILTTKPPTTSPTPSPTVTPYPALPVEDLVGNVVINEIADKGNPLACLDSNDYVEFKNIGNTSIDLVSLLLSDDDSETVLQLVFPGPNRYVMDAESILLLCNGRDFPFRIGGDDQITLSHPGSMENNFTRTIISQVGPMTRGGSQTSTYQRLTNGTYVYAFPTPNEETTGVVAGSFDDSSNNTTESLLTFPPTPAPPPAAPFDQVKDVVINEISDKGFESVCNGADYIELKNLGPEDVDLAGLTMHDDGGAAISGVTFPVGTVIMGNGDILLLCQGVYFSFGIGGSDTITLLHPNGEVDGSPKIISSVGPMTRGGTETISYQRLDDGSYQYLPSSPGV